MKTDLRTEQSQEYLSKADIHETWENDYLGSDLNPFYDAAFASIIDLLGAKPGDSILDAGCGYCFHAARLARFGLQVTGVDFSEAALAEARSWLDREGLSDRIRLQQANLLSLPFEDNAFQYVNCWGVLMHVPELSTALSELVRVVKPGGRLAITENNFTSLHVRLWEPSLRLVKRVIGRKTGGIVARTPRGQEEWKESQHAGGLMVRKTDVAWLEKEMTEIGAPLIHRSAGQFTEIYTSVRFRAAQRAIHAFNRWWFHFVRRPEWALGNILIFEKR